MSESQAATSTSTLAIDTVSSSSTFSLNDASPGTVRANDTATATSAVVATSPAMNPGNGEAINGGSAASSGSANVGAIVGGVIGGVALLVIVAGFLWYKRRKAGKAAGRMEGGVDSRGSNGHAPDTQFLMAAEGSTAEPNKTGNMTHAHGQLPPITTNASIVGASRESLQSQQSIHQSFQLHDVPAHHVHTVQADQRIIITEHQGVVSSAPVSQLGQRSDSIVSPQVKMAAETWRATANDGGGIRSPVLAAPPVIPPAPLYGTALLDVPVGLDNRSLSLDVTMQSHNVGFDTAARIARKRQYMDHMSIYSEISNRSDSENSVVGKRRLRMPFVQNEADVPLPIRSLPGHAIKWRIRFRRRKVVTYAWLFFGKSKIQPIGKSKIQPKNLTRHTNAHLPSAAMFLKYMRNISSPAAEESKQMEMRYVWSSVIRVYFESGTASDCRKAVQDLNMRRFDVAEAAAERALSAPDLPVQQERESGESGHELASAPNNTKSKWASFVDKDASDHDSDDGHVSISSRPQEPLLVFNHPSDRARTTSKRKLSKQAAKSEDLDVSDKRPSKRLFGKLTKSTPQPAKDFEGLHRGFSDTNETRARDVPFTATMRSTSIPPVMKQQPQSQTILANRAENRADVRKPAYKIPAKGNSRWNMFVDEEDDDEE
ncbi:hypothetical protein HDU78_008564 [Chytriomyces hyalinus]|nr:hypothetical protein HDU78_008564 [Chytriomyces hyalinus]